MKAFVATFIVLAALVARLSADEIDFSQLTAIDLAVISDQGLAKCIAKDPFRNNVFWLGGRAFDVGSLGYMDLPFMGLIVFDSKNQNTWGTSTSGLICVSVAGVKKVYTSVDGLPSNYVYAVKHDTAFNRLIVGTLAGVSIVQLDNGGNPTSFSNALSLSIHWVEVRGKDVWAVNTSHAYHFNGTSWETYDTSNSTVLDQCFQGAIDKDGNFYVATCKVYNNRAVAAMAKFNHQTGAWESIDMSSVDDSVISINQVRIDRDNQLWCTFPGHYLVKMDLATGTIWKSAIGGPTVRYTWLNESTCGQEPALGLMPDGNILIGANGKVLYGTSGSAVISRVSPKVVRGNFQVLGVFDPLGRKITANSFSAHSFPAGNYFTVTRSANGTIKAEKHSIVR